MTPPNADFAQMQIVNYTRRDMNLFQCKIGSRYETTPDQLRYVAAKIRKLLIQHSKVSPDPARARLSEISNSAYVLSMFAFVMAADWGEFRAIKEDLNLRIAEIVREFGTCFAFPSQTVDFTRPTPASTSRAASCPPRPRSASGGRKSAFRSRTSNSARGWIWRTLFPSQTSKARRTIGRTPPRRPDGQAVASWGDPQARLAGAASPREGAGDDELSCGPERT